jgi:histidinol-phosphate aminotransferase
VNRREWLQFGASALAALAFFRDVRASEPRAEGAPLRARLSLNENPFGPSPEALRAIVASLASVNRYARDDAEQLRAQIADREGVPTTQIVIGQLDAVLGFHLGVAAGEFLYSIPGYTDLVDAAAQVGGAPIGIPLNGRLEHDLEAFATRISQRTTAVFLVNPHNPTGTAVDPAALASFVGAVPPKTWIIVDEAYLEFMDDFEICTATRFTRAGRNVVVLRTFGKMYALPGLQIGYAVIPSSLVGAFHRFGLGNVLALNRLSIAAAAASLSDAAYVPATRDKVATERRRITGILRELRLHHSDSKGNFVFFETRRPHDEVATAFLAEGVEVARNFVPFDRWVRLSVGLPEENALAIAALRKLFG